MTQMLQSFAYNLTKNSEDAKDLYQETAFRAMTNREKFRAGTNFKAWLFTIMKNIFINNYRRPGQRQLDYRESRQSLLPQQWLGHDR